MSTIKNKQTDLSGVFSESISFRKVSGRVVAKNRPKRLMSDPTVGQTNVHETFKAAAEYAKRQLADEETKDMYAAAVTKKHRSAYSVAVRDFLVAPKVKLIDADDYHGVTGERILINAFDDFMVTKVKVTITDAAGTVLEQGEATPDLIKPHFWEYKATVANAALPGTKISAIAYDRPGNKGSLIKTLE